MNKTSAGEPAQLLTNGTIHSPSEPYADAMVVQDGLIAWVGASDTAQAREDVQLEVWDLDSALVAPAFVGWVDLPLSDTKSSPTREISPQDLRTRNLGSRTTDALNAAAALGHGAGRLSISCPVQHLESESELLTVLQEAFAAVAVHPVRSYPVVTITNLTALDPMARLDALERGLSLLAKVDSLLGRPAALQLDFADVREQLLEVRVLLAKASRQLILRVSDAEVGEDAQGGGGAEAGESAESLDLKPADVVAALVESTQQMRAQKVSTPGGLPTVLAGFDSAQRQDWETLLNTGVQVVLRGRGHLATALSVGVPVSAVGAPGQNPWAVVNDHVHHPQDPVSVRAGFNAQTRGAYRSMPETTGSPASSASLDTGARATYAVWEVDSLAVQTPDSRTAAWSTDVRARTPLLPYLDGEILPVLLATVIDGDTVHSTTTQTPA